MEVEKGGHFGLEPARRSLGWMEPAKAPMRRSVQITDAFLSFCLEFRCVCRLPRRRQREAPMEVEVEAPQATPLRKACASIAVKSNEAGRSGPSTNRRDN